MKTLLVCDGEVDVGGTVGVLEVFGLGGRTSAVRRMEERCRRWAPGAVILDSARLVDAEVDVVRARISRWSADMGEQGIAGKSVKDWMMTSGEGVSAWWFSALSEKNNIKTDIFFRLAQGQALDRLLESGGYDLCLFRLEDRRVQRVFEGMARTRGLRTRVLSGPAGWPRTLRRLRARCGVVGEVVHALYWFAVYGLRGIRARRALGFWSGGGGGALIVSYFPSLDKEAAARGVFRNRYAAPLQGVLAEMKIPVRWIFMFAAFGETKFSEALRLAKIFSKGGESVCFLNEFMGWAVAFRALRSWVQLLIRYAFRLSWINPQLLTRNFTSPALAPLLWVLWRQSFSGWETLSGLLYFELYKEIFKRWGSLSPCLYYAEMHPWEKALNRAKELVAPAVRTIGFQSGTVALGNFPYFHDPSEMPRTGRPTSLPLPDVLACNGDIPCGLLARQKYPGLLRVEAVRQLHLQAALAADLLPKPRPPAVLLAGNIDLAATASLLRLFQEAFPRPEDFRVWVKPHPATSARALFQEADLEPQSLGWLLREEPIEKLLPEASILIGAETSVTVEAMAYGCFLIKPVFSDAMFVSPLAGYERFYQKVSGPEELRRAVLSAAGEPVETLLKEARAHVSSYWNLDSSLPVWRGLFANSGKGAVSP